MCYAECMRDIWTRDEGLFPLPGQILRCAGDDNIDAELETALVREEMYDAACVAFAVWVAAVCCANGDFVFGVG